MRPAASLPPSRSRVHLRARLPSAIWNQPDDSSVANPVLEKRISQSRLTVSKKDWSRIEHPVDPPLPDPERERVQRLMLAAPGGNHS